MDINFGKYAVPHTLQKLIDLQEEIGDTEHFYLGFNFYLTLDNFRYFNTPADVVVFGHIGMDGVHYGLLTDFGTVNDLEEAMVVCVCPMDFDCPNRIVAKNIRGFLRVNLTDPELLYNTFKSEKSYLDSRKRWVEDHANSPFQPSEDHRLIKTTLQGWLKENIKMPVINNRYRYVQNVLMERLKTVTIPTQDAIGVTYPMPAGVEHTAFPLDKYKNLDLDSLREYLDSAPVASKYALFRNIQASSILGQQPELQNVIFKEMYHLGLVDEVKRLSIEI